MYHSCLARTWWKMSLSNLEESFGYRLHPASMSTTVMPNRLSYPYSHSRLLTCQSPGLLPIRSVRGELTPSKTIP